MIIPDGVRPRLGDRREFIHKKILRGIGTVAGLIPGGQIVSRVASRLAGQPGRTTTTLGPRRTLLRSQTARVTRFSEAEKDLGRRLKLEGQFGTQTLATSVRTRGFAGGVDDNGDGCIWPWRRDPRTGDCSVFIGRTKGPDGAGGGFELGEAVLGQYGAGLRPGSMVIDRAVCGRGMQLGNDGVCYNKSQISNKQRMWPAGRKPLLTGGDMRAISTAARAGKRMDLATSRLQKLGMMKKPTSRRAVSPAEISQIRHAAVLEAHAGSKH